MKVKILGTNRIRIVLNGEDILKLVNRMSLEKNDGKIITTIHHEEE